jgi:hypothetical protein
MHTVELLAHALEVAERLGYSIRQEWLGGSGGGACEIRGQKVLFLDLALSPAEQLELVLDLLNREPSLANLAMPPALTNVVRLRKIA